MTRNRSAARPLPPHSGRRLQGDGGASIIEAAVAMVIAVILLVGLAGSMASGLRGLQENRLQGQATQVGMERLEYARNLTFAQLAVDPAVSDSDPRIILNPRFLRGSAFGLPGNEELIEKSYGAPDGALPYLYSTTVEGVVFTVKSYISRPRAGLRRVIVCVGWDTGQGTSRELVMSTTISEVSST